jgi:hypothetical protein
VNDFGQMARMSISDPRPQRDRRESNKVTTHLLPPLAPLLIPFMGTRHSGLDRHSQGFHQHCQDVTSGLF